MTKQLTDTTRHVYSMNLPNDVFDYCISKDDITKKFIEMIRGNTKWL